MGRVKQLEQRGVNAPPSYMDPVVLPHCRVLAVDPTYVQGGTPHNCVPMCNSIGGSLCITVARMVEFLL